LIQESITIQHAELILKWIDKLEITDNMKNSYRFKMILRGSCDGFSPRKFHEMCDNKSNTVSIIKVKDSNEILGGYNPVRWKSIPCYSITEDSFIFSFKNGENTEKCILSRISYKNFAIFNHPNFGPSFGNGLTLSGKNFYNKSCCNNVSCYKTRIREFDSSFSVEEFEVFRIIKD
jgi:hypothetical protein